MLISVVVPTCHRNDLLARCLEGLAPGAQTLPADQYEVIVTDDGTRSTAQSLITEQFPWARWVDGPKRGPAANRNFGAGQANAEWIAFTDDDCVPQPGWLAAYAAALTSGHQVYEGKTTCVEPWCPITQATPVDLNGGFLWSCNMLVHRTTFEKLGGFAEIFPLPSGEDTDFRERLRFQKIAFPFIEAAVVDHPPRARKLFLNAARQLETDIVLWYRAGNRGLPTLRLFKQVLVQRVARLRAWGKWDKALWIGTWSMLTELGCILLWGPGWAHKWFTRLKDQSPEYHYRQM